MYQNQMNSMNTVNPMNMNGMNPMNLNLLSNNSNNNTPSFLTGIPIPNANHLRNTNNHINHIIGESPDSLRSTSNNSANNSTITPTDPSLFMPTIGAINNSSSPPITSPHIMTQIRANHPSFNSSPFRFDQITGPNVGSIQSIQSQPIMQSMNAAPTQTVLFKPQFVHRPSTTTPYQVHNHRPSAPYALNNRFTPKLNNAQFIHAPAPNPRYPETQQFTQQIPTQLDNNNSNLAQMPLLQNDPGLDTFNVSNHLNVNPGFSMHMHSDSQLDSQNPNNLHLLPPNLFVNNNNMMNMLITTPQTHTNNTNILHGPKKSIPVLTTTANNHNLPKLRGCEKFGFVADKAIITDLHQVANLSLPKPGKRRGRPPKTMDTADTKLGIKALKKGRGRKKKDGQDAIEFIKTVQWSAAHKYHQYCPFCVRDERKKHKFEFWEKLPLRETLNKHQRKEYDRDCKQLLQSIEDKIKKKVTFASGVEYRRHYDTFHKKYGFKCIYSGCVKESSSWYNFVAHLTQHDRETGRPFHCAYNGCNRRSSTKHNLIKHLQGVHKWKIINKEEPKQCMKSSNGGAVRIKCESITTASPSRSPNCGKSSGVGGGGGIGIGINIGNGGWRGAMNNFDLKMKGDLGEEKKYVHVRSDVVQEPIINDKSQSQSRGQGQGQGQGPGRGVDASCYYNSDNVPPPIMYRMCYNRMKPQPIPYANSSRMNGASTSMPSMPTNDDKAEKKERVSNNNCIVSPHLLTAIRDHPFIDDEENDDDSLSVSNFPLNHNTKDYDNIDIFNSTYNHRVSPLPIHHNTIFSTPKL